VVDYYYDMKKRGEFKSMLQDQLRLRKEMQGAVSMQVGLEAAVRMGAEVPLDLGWPSCRPSWTPLPAPKPPAAPAAFPARPVAAFHTAQPAALDRVSRPMDKAQLVAFVKEYIGV
jgi:hypothetical protein